VPAAIAAAADAAVGVERVLEQGHARVLRLIEWAAGRCREIASGGPTRPSAMGDETSRT
jgi:hypothetical protein